MQRRRFMETCSGALLCSTLAETALAAGAAGAPRQYQRTRLMDETGAPLRASEIPPRRLAPPAWSRKLMKLISRAGYANWCAQMAAKATMLRAGPTPPGHR